MALQFCRATAGVNVTLLGMRTADHLRENLRYFASRPLADAEYAGT